MDKFDRKQLMTSKLVNTILCLLGISVIFYLIRREMFIAKLQVGTDTLYYDSKEELNFFAVGDTGTGEIQQFAVALAMERACTQLPELDGIWHLGDIFYPAGVQDIYDLQWQEKVEKPFGSPCLKKVPIFPVLGNHDYKGNAEAIIEYSKTHHRWRMPKRFYRMQFGNMLNVVAFDSNFPDFCFSSKQCALDFLIDSLDKPSTKYSVVLAHSPLKSSSTKRHSHRGGIFGFLMAPLICNRADAWIAGHAHFLELAEMQGCRSDSLISGGGGGDLYDVTPGKEPGSFKASAHGFLHVQVTVSAIKYRFIDSDNQILFEKIRRS